MKNSLPFLLLFTTLTSCKTRTPREYFNRPLWNECITLNEKGLMSCNGIVKEIQSGSIIPETVNDYFEAREYCEEREYGHYICLLFPEKCNQ